MGLGDRFDHTPMHIHALTRTPSDEVKNYLSMPSGVWASSQKQPVAASAAGSCDTTLLAQELCTDSGFTSAAEPVSNVMIYGHCSASLDSLSG